MNQTDSSLWREYYILTKPGIIRGNLLTAIGGFFLGLSGNILWGTLAALLFGMSLVIGASCVINNYLDRNIDGAMTRTKRRAIVSGRISGKAALLFGSILAIVGFTVLIVWTNPLTVALGLIGLVSYVALYTPAKHRTPYATLIGTIPGAIPPVAGYAAASGQLDKVSLLLFLILITWQMPHFYAIAIRRLDEYKAAKVPVWPAVYGRERTWRQMNVFGGLFLLSIIGLWLTGRTSAVFILVLLGYSFYWCSKFMVKPNDSEWQTWAKRIFLLSLPVLPLLTIMSVIDYLFF